VSPSAMGVNIGLLDPPNWDARQPGWTHATFVNPRRHLGLLAAAGARGGRGPFFWADLADRGTGRIDTSRPEWERIDSTLAMARDSGFSIVGVLTTHTWYQPVGYPSLDAWETYVSQVLDRESRFVSHWSIWNEPNCDGYLSRGTSPVRGADYAALVTRAGPIIHGHRGRVVAGEISWWDPGYPHCTAGVDFLRELMAVAGPSIDIVSMTSYKANGPGIRESVQQAVSTLRANGCVQPLWLTEFGMDVENPPDADEATMLSDVLLHPVPGLERMFAWHGFVWDPDDHRGMLKPADSTMGRNNRWVYSNPTPRLSYVAYQRAKYGCDWRQACPGAPDVAAMTLSIVGPASVLPGETCTWRGVARGGVWPYAERSWRTTVGRERVDRDLVVANDGQPFTVEVSQVDALGRVTIARKEVRVDANAKHCTR